MSDLNMLRGPGGCERTEQQYCLLLAQSGFRQTSVRRAGRFSVLEARTELVEQTEQLAQLGLIATELDVARLNAVRKGALLQRDGIECGAGQRQADIGLVR